ncbi:MAG: metal ABC transporter substrate-binding protein [Desulfurococcales archaeon]|nr:metal ABC transporter substrate-binding protein [Desulfurococcales archaeon]
MQRQYAVMLVLLTLVAVGGAGVSAAESGKIVVAVTMPYLAHVVEAVGGSQVRVVELIPPGVDAHDYEPPYSDLIKELRSADLIVMTGPSHLALESRIKELRESGVFTATIIDYEEYVRFGLTLLKNPRTGLVNPHGYFFSYSGLEAIAKAVAAALAGIDPSKQQYFMSRADAFVDLLEAYRSTLTSQLSHQRVALVSPILQYVAKDLELNVTYVLLPDPSVQPTQADLGRLKSLVTTGEVTTVLMTDVEVSKNPKLVDELRNLGVNPVIVSLTRHVDAPELIPSALAQSLQTLNAGTCGGPEGFQLGTSLLLGGILAEAIVIAGLVILLFKWRRAVIEAICKGFEVGE